MSIVVTYLQVITFLLITGVHPWLLDNDCLQGFSKKMVRVRIYNFSFLCSCLIVYRPFSKNLWHDISLRLINVQIKVGDISVYPCQSFHSTVHTTLLSIQELIWEEISEAHTWHKLCLWCKSLTWPLCEVKDQLSY